MEIDYTHVCGSRIRYGISPGGEQHPPLLICNGIGQSIETLETLASALGDRTVILYDAPGAGDSAVPRLPMGIRQHSCIAVDLLGKLGHEQADIMGISWGGSVAQQIAKSHPEHCRRLILAITCAGGLLQIPGPVDVMLEMMFPLRYMCSRHRNNILSKLYGGDALRDPSLILRQYERNKAPRMYGYYQQLIAMRCWSSVHWLHRLRQPTLILSGEQDPLIPPLNQKILAKLIPDSDLRSYDCGHLIMTSRQQQVVSDVEDFLNA